MSELNIKIRKLQDNGSTFRSNPETLYLGGVGSAKVDQLHFEVPEEWKNCTITLHVRRLSGTLPDPQLLDENCNVLVDRRWTLETQGSWMLLAMDENGYIAMTKPGLYTCYETIDTNSTTETLTPSIYEQFVAQVTSWANAAKESMNAAAGSAKKAEAEADRAEQAVADLDQTREDSIRAVKEAQNTATETVEQTKTDAVKAVGDKLTESLDEVDETKETALKEMGAVAAAAKESADDAAKDAAKAEEAKQEAEASKEAAASSEANAKFYSEASKEAVTQNAKGYGGGYSRTFTLAAPQEGWAKLETPIGIYHYYIDVALADCTAKWNAFAAVLPESSMTAFVARVANVIDTQDGSVRLYAVNAPEGDINFTLSVFAVGSRTYSLTVPASGWIQAENAVGANQWQCDLELEDSSVEKVPMGMAALENTTEALSSPGLSATMETFDGSVRVYAKSKPAVDINILVILLARNEVN